LRRYDYQAIYWAVTEELADFDEFARQVRAYPHKEAGQTMDDVEPITTLDPAVVLGKLRAELPGLLVEQPVMLAYLYGSVAEGYALPTSDVDVALVLSPDHGLSSYQRLRLELKLAAELEARCGWDPVDVRSMNDAPLMVQGKVVTEGILVYLRDEDFRVEYETLTRKRYFDFLPVARLMRRAYFEHMERDLRCRKVLADGQTG